MYQLIFRMRSGDLFSVGDFQRQEDAEREVKSIAMSVKDWVVGGGYAMRSSDIESIRIERIST